MRSGPPNSTLEGVLTVLWSTCTKAEKSKYYMVTLVEEVKHRAARAALTHLRHTANTTAGIHAKTKNRKLIKTPHV